MKQLLSFVRKEFYHVLRDRKVLLILFGLPVVQVLLFGFILSNEVKNTRIAVVDYAHDNLSNQLIAKLETSRYFDIEKINVQFNKVETVFRDGKIKSAIIFPTDFERQLLHSNRAQLQIITEATDVNTATTINGFMTAIINEFTSSINNGNKIPYIIIPETRFLYNPQMAGAPNFVPGVMAMVMLLVCVLMTSVAIVKEKETGTMEVLLISPMKPALVIISKAIPYLILSFINLLAILFLSVYVLDVPVKGSLILLLAESILFIIACLTLGILISIKTASQQAAMFASLLGMLLPTLMLSGFMFPIENMPMVLQIISNVVPSKWFYIIVKNVMIKGTGFEAVWKETLILVVTTLILFIISLKNFKIRLN